MTPNYVPQETKINVTLALSQMVIRKICPWKAVTLFWHMSTPVQLPDWSLGLHLWPSFKMVQNVNVHKDQKNQTQIFIYPSHRKTAYKRCFKDNEHYIAKKRNFFNENAKQSSTPKHDNQPWGPTAKKEQWRKRETDIGFKYCNYQLQILKQPHLLCLRKPKASLKI